VQVLHLDVGTIRLFVCMWFWSIWFSNDPPWQIFICRKDANSARPLEGLQIVDVGCGGGLLCEPLARMGGLITGIDAVEKNLGVASLHAARDPATASIKYLCTTAEQMVHEQEKFDVVIALEVCLLCPSPMDVISKSCFALLC
jgi:ubiquinone biosynthesis O-methyltransferase